MLVLDCNCDIEMNLPVTLCIVDFEFYIEFKTLTRGFEIEIKLDVRHVRSESDWVKIKCDTSVH